MYYSKVWYSKVQYIKFQCWNRIRKVFDRRQCEVRLEKIRNKKKELVSQGRVRRATPARVAEPRVKTEGVLAHTGVVHMCNASNVDDCGPWSFGQLRTTSFLVRTVPLMVVDDNVPTRLKQCNEVF